MILIQLLLAKKGNKIIVALPGFAYSSTICAILYVLPLIYKFQNSSKTLQKVKAKIEQDLNNQTNKKIFTACNLEYKNGQYFVNFKDKKSGTSAILTNMLNSPALLIQEENSFVKSGDLVDVLLLNNF